MEMMVGKPDYAELGNAPIDRLKDAHRNREGMEETMDNEMGPDVRYVLSRNDIKLVKRFLMGPITPAEYRELSFKLRELQQMQVGKEKEHEPWNSAETEAAEKAKMEKEDFITYDPKENILDLVA